MMRHGYEVFHPQVAVLVDFYTRVLGFSCAQRVDAETAYADVHRDQLQVGCCRAENASTAPRRPPDGIEIVLRVEDLAAEHDRVRARGWPITDGMQERPWGMTDFRLFDPSGQYIRITGPAKEP